MPHRDDLELNKFEVHHDDDDGLFPSLRVVSSINSYINFGQAFMAGEIFNGVANNAVVNCLLRLTEEIHFILNVAASGDCEVRVFEDTTFSAAGTVIPVFNKNRSSSRTTNILINHTPTITADGTELPPSFLAGGSGGNANGGNADGYEGKIILAANKNYLVRVKNVKGTSSTISPKFHWFDPSS